MQGHGPVRLKPQRSAGSTPRPSWGAQVPPAKGASARTTPAENARPTPRATALYPSPTTDVRMEWIVPALALAVVGGFAAWTMFANAHDHLDAPEPDVAAAQTALILAIGMGTVAVAAGIVAAGRHAGLAALVVLPVAAVIGVTAAGAAESYATSEHCEGQAAINSDRLGPMLMGLLGLAVVACVVVVVACSGRPGGGAPWVGVIAGAVAGGGAAAAAWHAITLNDQAATAQADWQAWAAREASMCQPVYYTPSLGIFVAVAALLGYAWLRR